MSYDEFKQVSGKTLGKMNTIIYELTDLKRQIREDFLLLMEAKRLILNVSVKCGDEDFLNFLKAVFN